MRRTPGNIDLTVICRCSLAEIIYKFQQVLNSNKDDEEIIVTSNDRFPEDEELHDISRIALRLKYEIDQPISIYAIISFSPMTITKHKKRIGRVITFDDVNEFLNESNDLKELGDLIGDIIYEGLTNPMESGIYFRPFNE